MVRCLTGRKYGPIAVDLGSRSVKLLQLSADRQQVVDSVRWDLPQRDSKETTATDVSTFAEAIQQARHGRSFRGRDAVLCLGSRELFVQNIRVNKTAAADLDHVVRQEASGRLPFSIAEAEIRYIEAADVRQGEQVKREVILLACRKPVLAETLNIVESAGLKPRAVDVEPAALLRCYNKQFRREEDREARVMYLHIGASNTAVIIARGDEALFIKYIELGGQHFDEAVAHHLNMDVTTAAALRRHNGDRRADSQDPEIARTVSSAIRPLIERLCGEVAMCIRYHSVTFRGQVLSRVVLGGGEATDPLRELIGDRLNIKCELGDPLRHLKTSSNFNRRAQWDVATGLALREAL